MILLLIILAFGFPLAALIWKLRQDKLARDRKLRSIQKRLKEVDASDTSKDPASKS